MDFKQVNLIKYFLHYFSSNELFLFSYLFFFINLDISEIIASKAYKEKERSYSKIFIKNLLIKYVF